MLWLIQFNQEELSMKGKVPVVLSGLVFLSVLVFASPVKADQVQDSAKTDTSFNYSDTEFSKAVGRLVVGGLTLFFLIQVSNKK